MLLTLLKHGVIASTFFVLYLLYWPNLVNIEPKAYDVVRPEEFTGPLQTNTLLSQAERLFEGQIKGPESLVEYKDSIYTGLVDGRIIKITGDKFKAIKGYAKPCEGPWDEPKCGRPLGLRVLNDTLYVVDAYRGLIAIDLTTEESKVIMAGGEVIDSKPVSFLNDLVIDEEDGVIYMTESSTKWPLQRIIFSVLEHENTGRLIKFDLKTNQKSVVLDNLYMPNGIEMGPDKQSILFSECTESRIMRYYTKGPKKGKLEVFIENLPGEPDNIRRSKKGGYWIPMVIGRTMANPSITDRLAQHTVIRKIHAKMIDLVGSVLKYLCTYWPNEVLKFYAHEVHSGHFMYRLLPLRGMVIKVNDKGEYVRTLQSSDGKCAFVSEVLEVGDYLYLGSFRNPFIGRVKN